VVSAGATWAGPIEFVYTGVGSGALNGVPFAASNFTITEFADTSNRQSCTFGLCTFIDDTSATITISGLGTFHFLTPTRTVVSGGLSFSRMLANRPNPTTVPDPPALDNYMLDARFGPALRVWLVESMDGFSADRLNGRHSVLRRYDRARQPRFVSSNTGPGTATVGAVGRRRSCPRMVPSKTYPVNHALGYAV
jgi:hypothetical protein